MLQKQHNYKILKNDYIQLLGSMKVNYENSLFYQIHVSDKFFRSLFEQFFKEINIGVSAIEHLALLAISSTKDCCQRDLAKIILKDRAGAGKLALILEKKGLINIDVKTKNSRQVRILSLTKKGEEITQKALDLIEPATKRILENVGVELVENTKKTLAKVREATIDIMKNKI